MCDHADYVTCVLCHEANTEEVIRVGRYVRCKNDGLLYMNPRPQASEVREFHTGFVRENNLDLFDGYRREVLKREAEAIRKIKPAGNLLDVGCATGTFFANFPSEQWHLYGVDSSAVGVEAARRRYPADVYCGTLAEARYPAGFFDIVTVLDTLYYNQDPEAELKEIHRVLTDDGLLAVELPGYVYSLCRERGPLCWLLDGTWVRGFGGTHRLFYFSPATTRLLLERSGFRLLKMLPEQASLGRRGAARLLNEVHFALARLLFKASRGKVSIAGKELYLAAKA